MCPCTKITKMNQSNNYVPATLKILTFSYRLLVTCLYFIVLYVHLSSVMSSVPVGGIAERPVVF